jgi:hypothetical protein
MPISSARSGTIRTFATLRFVGDALEPEEISNIIKAKPRRAHKKGGVYRPGPQSPEVTSKTGIWYFSTRKKIRSSDLADHINALEMLVCSPAYQDDRLGELYDIMKRRKLQAHATLFWHGPPGAQPPAIPPSATASLRRLPADIQEDFATEAC